ncbi:Pentatricopeptide repeat-containing protein, chloroplastic [Vitis vinifera]|uniref:Pentatricopeptide repeat-containing protein, chloroplastic n=1 Tax=Vitis vinifera TaxID=29760 RepID=A0A438GBG5_VITVI|nr:Pentatricopeptide repeat-containing protein, chloroplastic [Vitis vinifera]
MGATSQWIVIILKGYEAGTEVAPLGEGCGPLRIVFVDDILVEFEQVAGGGASRGLVLKQLGSFQQQVGHAGKGQGRLSSLWLDRRKQTCVPARRLTGSIMLSRLISPMQLLDLKDSKEAVYGALDAWVAWEQNFPIASLKRVVKWMLSKGQGTTMGTYGQLIRALDMDHRAEEAHEFWVKKIGTDLHSVPWHLCHRMISINYWYCVRLTKLVTLLYFHCKLFKGLEAFDRKPQDKLVVKKVADAYEMLGLLEEKERIFEKYDYLFTETGREAKEIQKFLSEKKKSGQRKPTSTPHDLTPGDGIQAE